MLVFTVDNHNPCTRQSNKRTKYMATLLLNYPHVLDWYFRISTLVSGFLLVQCGELSMRLVNIFLKIHIYGINRVISLVIIGLKQIFPQTKKSGFPRPGTWLTFVPMRIYLSRGCGCSLKYTSICCELQHNFGYHRGGYFSLKNIVCFYIMLPISAIFIASRYQSPTCSTVHYVT